MLDFADGLPAVSLAAFMRENLGPHRHRLVALARFSASIPQNRQDVSGREGAVSAGRKRCEVRRRESERFGERAPALAVWAMAHGAVFGKESPALTQVPAACTPRIAKAQQSRQTRAGRLRSTRFQTVSRTTAFIFYGFGKDDRIRSQYGIDIPQSCRSSFLRGSLAGSAYELIAAHEAR